MNQYNKNELMNCDLENSFLLVYLSGTLIIMICTFIKLMGPRAPPRLTPLSVDMGRPIWNSRLHVMCCPLHFPLYNRGRERCQYSKLHRFDNSHSPRTVSCLPPWSVLISGRSLEMLTLRISFFSRFLCPRVHPCKVLVICTPHLCTCSNSKILVVYK